MPEELKRHWPIYTAIITFEIALFALFTYHFYRFDSQQITKRKIKSIHLQTELKDKTEIYPLFVIHTLVNYQSNVYLGVEKCADIYYTFWLKHWEMGSDINDVIFKWESLAEVEDARDLLLGLKGTFDKYVLYNKGGESTNIYGIEDYRTVCSRFRNAYYLDYYAFPQFETAFKRVGDGYYFNYKATAFTFFAGFIALLFSGIVVYIVGSRGEGVAGEKDKNENRERELDQHVAVNGEVPVVNSSEPQ